MQTLTPLPRRKFFSEMRAYNGATNYYSMYDESDSTGFQFHDEAKCWQKAHTNKVAFNSKSRVDRWLDVMIGEQTTPVVSGGESSG